LIQNNKKGRIYLAFLICITQAIVQLDLADLEYMHCARFILAAFLFLKNDRFLFASKK